MGIGLWSLYDARGVPFGRRDRLAKKSCGEGVQAVKRLRTAGNSNRVDEFIEQRAVSFVRGVELDVHEISSAAEEHVPRIHPLRFQIYLEFGKIHSVKARRASG